MAWTSKDRKRNEEKLRLRELQFDLHLGQMDWVRFRMFILEMLRNIR
jgi:hypothetical protein